MKAYYDHEPQRIEAVGNGKYFYRWNISEVEAPSQGMDGMDEPRTEWMCDEVVFLPPMSVDNVAAIVANEIGISEQSDEFATIRYEVGMVVIPLDIEAAKEELKGKILAYDSSDAVNSFSFQGVSMWLDKATRVGLKLRFEAEIRLGKETTTLWTDGMGFTLPLTGEGNAVDLLDGIELYASASYDVTQQHLAEVSSLTTATEILAYDYKSGYPEKLAF